MFLWWKDVRPNRPDPYDVSGWSDVSDKWNIMSSKDDCKEKRKEIDAARIKINQIEEQYEKEDTEMMKCLIDVRKALWT